MKRMATWWVMVALLLVFDVVTVAFHLLAQPWQGLLLGASAVVVLGFVGVRVLDWRMHRRHRREAFAHLARVRAGRTRGEMVNP